jgi:predicted nucleotidyltransferase
MSNKDEIHQRFKIAVNEIFGAENVVMAFVHGSMAREDWSSVEFNERGSDVDLFICVEHLNDEQRFKFEAWYNELNQELGLVPSDRFPIELMTEIELRKSQEKLPKIQIAMAGNSHETWDALSWSEYIARPTLEKFGRSPEVIEELSQTAKKHTDKWGDQVLDNLNNMHHAEMFHRTGKLFVPWAQKLVSFLANEPEIGLHYDKYKKRYVANEGVSSHSLTGALRRFSEQIPLDTITDPDQLRAMKRTYVIDEVEGLHIDAIAKFMSDPESAVSIKDHQSTRLLADFPEQWKSQLLGELSNKHSQYVFGDTLGHLIDWHTDFPDKRLRNGIQSEPVLGAIRYPLVNDTYIELSDDWIQRQIAYRMLWKELSITELFDKDKIVVAEHGSGTGDNSALIAQGWPGVEYRLANGSIGARYGHACNQTGNPTTA